MFSKITRQSPLQRLRHPLRSRACRWIVCGATLAALLSPTVLMPIPALAAAHPYALTRLAVGRKPVIVVVVEATTTTSTTTTTVAGSTTSTSTFSVAALLPNDPRCRNRLTFIAQLERQKAKVLTNLAKSEKRLRKAEAEGRPALAAALADEVNDGQTRVDALQADIDLVKQRCP